MVHVDPAGRGADGADGAARDILLYLSWLMERRRRSGLGARLRLRLLTVHSVVDGAIVHTFVPEDGTDASFVSHGVLAGLNVVAPDALEDGGAALRTDLARQPNRSHAHRMLVAEWW